jgi:hypothetical protein
VNELGITGIDHISVSQAAPFICREIAKNIILTREGPCGLEGNYQGISPVADQF